MGLQVRALGRREPTMGLVWIIHLQFAFAIMDVHTAQLAHVCFQEAALNWIHGPEASHTWYWAVPTVPRTPNAGSSGQDVLPPKKKKDGSPWAWNIPRTLPFSGLSLPRTLQVLVWNRQPSCHDELTGKLRTIGYQRVPASMASHMPTAVGNDWQSDVC